MTPKLFYLKYISDHIDTCLYPYQGKELFYQQIKDLKRVSEICEADTVIKILVLLLQEPDHCYVIPAAQVVLYPFFRVVYSFVAMGLVKLYGGLPFRNMNEADTLFLFIFVFKMYLEE